MIIEQRTYTLKLGAAPLYFSTYEKNGLAVQRRLLGNLVGYYTTDMGELNLVVHQWAYESYADREQRRAKLYGDPEWAAYLAKSRELGLIQKQETCVFTPAPFFEPILRAMMAGGARV